MENKTAKATTCILNEIKPGAWGRHGGQRLTSAKCKNKNNFVVIYSVIVFVRIFNYTRSRVNTNFFPLHS